MGILTASEIVASFGQLTGVFSAIEFKMPPGFEWIKEILNFLRFDLAKAFAYLNIKGFDFRFQHTLLTSILPLFLASFLLFLFKPPGVVLWYCFLLISLLSFVSGLALYITNGNAILLSLIGPIEIILGGLGGIGVCVLIALLKISFNRISNRNVFRIQPTNANNIDEDDECLNQIINLTEEAKAKSKPFLIQARNFLFATIILTLGIFILFDVKVLADMFYFYSPIHNFFESIPAYIGYICMTTGILLYTNWLMNLFRQSRIFLSKASFFLRKNIIKVVLLLLGLFYLPITASIWQSLNCVEIQALAGTEFVNPDLDSYNINVFDFYKKRPSSGMAVLPCNYNTPESTQFDICPSQKSYRLKKDYSISCRGDMLPRYGFLSLVSLLSIVLGVPILFYRLISISVNVIRKIPVQHNLSESQKWKAQCLATSCCCKTLFSMFEARWSYYKLFVILHKLLCISIVIWIEESKIAPALCLLVLNVAMTAFSLISRPYIRVIEDSLASVCFTLSSLNSVMVILLIYEINVPPAVFGLLALLNAVFPTIFVVTSIVYEFKEHRADARQKLEHFSQLDDSTVERTSQVDSIATKSTIEKNNFESIVRRTAELTPEPEEKTITFHDVESGRQEKTLSKTLKGKNLQLSPMQMKFLRIQRVIEALDQNLDIQLMQTLVNYFLFIGVTCIVGILVVFFTNFLKLLPSDVYESMNVVTANRAFTMGRDFSHSRLEFAGYNSWQEFTKNCHCNLTVNTNSADFELKKNESSFVLWEVWKCNPAQSLGTESEFVYKIRRRIQNGHDGLILRDYCSKEFKNSTGADQAPYVPMINETLGRYEILAPEISDDVIKRDLW